MTTPDQTLPDTVSAEAHRRVTTERDQYKARVAELENTVTDLGLHGKAFDYFAGKNPADAQRAKHLADLALPHLRGVAVDDIGGRLEMLFPESMVAAPAAPNAPKAPEGSEDDAPEEAAPAVPAVPPIAGGPDPAAPGNPPTPQKIALNSPEMRERIRTQGWGSVREAIRAGEVTFDPQNEHAQRIAGR